jgi:hypothetical protein
MRARRSVKGEAVKRELLPGQSEALLRELHLLTPGGDLNADALRKLKQVNHLVNLLRPALEDVFNRFGEPQVVDAASGNGYLAFVLYELYFQPEGRGELHCVEARPDLAERARARAQRLGFSRMRIHAAPLAQASFPERFHLLTALHACDTATDDALVAAIRHNVDHVAVVPCCQAEVARQLQTSQAQTSPVLQPLYAHPWHRREFAAHLTNVLRVLALEAAGYKVTVTELTGWEHSLKNELLLGRKVRRGDEAAKAQLEGLLAQTGTRPKLISTLWPGSA